MSLLDDFLILEKEKLSYYYENMIHVKPISNPSKAWTFIDEYFKEGAKSSALADKDVKKLERDGKHLHTVSMYFLGISLRTVFEMRLKDKFDSLFVNYGHDYRYDFTYTWFITCLFHDFSWIHEKDNHFNHIIESNNCLYRMIIDYYNIKHEVFVHKLVKGKVFRTKYNKETIINYLDYRFKKWSVADHGIVAGMLLYDRLVRNYHDNWIEFKTANDEEKYSIKYFYYKNKHWREEHLDHFAYISDSIISHNIWFGSDKELYKQYGLEEILQQDENRISLNNDPLLFCLGFLDTIEPIKFFYNFSCEYIWGNIDIVNDHSSVRIIVSDVAVFNYLDWFKKISSLSEWLNVDVMIDKRELTLFTNKMN